MTQVRTGKKKRFSKLTPARQYALLNSPEAIRTMSPEFRSEHHRRLRREQRRIELTAPSSTWAEAAWERGEKWPDGWKLCPVCHRYSPPVAFGSTGVCLDCAYGSMSDLQLMMLPSSPSGLAIRVAAMLGIRLKFK